LGLRFTCRVLTSATDPVAAAPAEGTPKPELLEAALITFTGLLALLEEEEDEEDEEDEEGWPKPMVVTPAEALLVALPFSIYANKQVEW